MANIAKPTPEMEALWGRGFAKLPGVGTNDSLEYAASVGRVSFEDKDFDWLHQHFPNLTNVGFRLSQITDAGTIKLTQFKKLEKLDLAGTRITDKTLAHVATLKSLKDLNLEGTPVSHAGMKLIAAGLLDLERLDIAATPATDKALEELMPLQKLKYLSVSRTSVTRQGIDQFKQSHPDCFVRSDFE